MITDPIYTVTITNDTAGWSYTTTQGDAYDPLEPVQLADGLTMRWQFKDGDFFNALDVEQVSFALLVSDAADIPAVEQGHIVHVKLDRGPTIPYMHFGGRITDVDADTHPEYGTVLSLIAGDPTSELTDHHYPEPLVYVTDANGIYLNALNKYYRVGSFAWPNGWTAGPETHVADLDGPLSDLVDKITAGSLQRGVGGWSLRYTADPWIPSGLYGMASGSIFAYDPALPFHFYVQPRPGRITAAFAALFEFAYSTDDPDMVTVNYAQPTVVDPNLTVLDGDFIATPQHWRKDRSFSPNNVVVTGRANPSFGDELTESVSTPARDVYGTVTKTLETLTTFGYITNDSDIPEAVLEYVPSPGQWAADAVTVMPERLADDAQLDALATQFYPHSKPTESVLGRPVVVTNVAEQIDLVGGFMYGIMVGCEFRVSGGDLRIKPQLQPMAMLVAPGVDTSTSFTTWTASAFTNATFDDQGGTTDYIDPSLTFDQFMLSTL